MKLKFAGLLLFMSFLQILSAQTEESKPSRLSSARFVAEDYENDVFNETDNYYTQGIRFELVLPYLHISSVGHALLRLRKNAVQYFGASLVQECYTPSTIRHEGLFVGDRPYAAVGYTGRYLVSNDEVNKQRLKSEIDFGLIGPCAVCEEEQKAIHRALVDPQPVGWEHQIRQDVIFSYSVAYDKGLLHCKYADLILQGKLTAGTLYDKAEAGGMIRAGKMVSYFSAISPGENEESRKFSFYGFLRGWVQGVGYDATMQGGFFDRNNDYTITNSNIEGLVYGYQYGLSCSWKKLSLQYSKVLITPEFRDGTSHGWGRITITVAL
jgi:lipid A 3-O-deacylase